MNDGINKVLNKIADIFDSMSLGIMDNVDDSDFLRGYMTALMESNEITDVDRIYLMQFYKRLMDDKIVVRSSGVLSIESYFSLITFLNTQLYH